MQSICMYRPSYDCERIYNEEAVGCIEFVTFKDKALCMADSIKMEPAMSLS